MATRPVELGDLKSPCPKKKKKIVTTKLNMGAKPVILRDFKTLFLDDKT